MAPFKWPVSLKGEAIWTQVERESDVKTQGGDVHRKDKILPSLSSEGTTPANT